MPAFVASAVDMTANGHMCAAVGLSGSPETDTRAPSASSVSRSPGSCRRVTVTRTVAPLWTCIDGPACVSVPPSIEKARYVVVVESLQSCARSVQSLMAPNENAPASKVALPPTSSTKNAWVGAALKYTSPAGAGLHGSTWDKARELDQIRCTVKSPS